MALDNRDVNETRIVITPKLVLLLVLPFIGLMMLLKAAGAGQVTAPPTEPKRHSVDVINVEKLQQYQRHLKAVGRAEANQQSALGFELAGTLATTYADEGDWVEAGALLAVLDTKRLDAQMVEVNASVARAESDARLAKLSEDRIAQLVKERLESPQRLDEVREATIAANARVTEIRANRTRIQVELEKSRLLAPYSGTILTRPVDPGSVVAQGQSVFTMQEGGKTEVRIALGADGAQSVKVGDTYPLSKGSEVWQATVKSIAKARNLSTRTVDVIFELETSDRLVLPGDLLTLTIPQTVHEQGYWLPKTALSNGVRGLWTVFTVKDQKIHPKFVEILYSNVELAYVSGALQPDDQVVVSGTQRVAPQQSVSVRLIEQQTLARR